MSEMKKILLVDDDSDIHNIVTHALSSHFSLQIAHNIQLACDTLVNHDFDLIILDEGLPDGSGTDLCFKIRNDFKKEGLPIIMLTSRKDLKDKLMAFNSGADDYVIKPFEPLELLARINARLKTSASSDSTGGPIERGDLVLDLEKQTLGQVKAEGLEDIPLTPIEFKILYFLAKEPEAVYNRTKILEAVWGKDQHVIERTVDQHISKLRKKLSPTEWTIKSLHRQGYLFTKSE